MHIMHIEAEEWIQLKHPQRRCLINKWRRSWRRKAVAMEGDEAQEVLKSQPEYLEKLVDEELQCEEEERKRVARSQLEHEAWLQKERTAQQEHRTRVEREERILREREERERLIKEEWEALQRKEQVEQEKRDKAKREKEERLREALSTADKPAHDPWHNPPAPDTNRQSGQNYGTERDGKYCSFFLKTGACRFGDRCSKQHPRIASSTTLLVPAMYNDLRLKEIMLNERGQDAELEYDEGDIYQHFQQFFDDTLPEFTKAGKVIQFKVSCNYEPHLRGNVYVQYASEEECTKAYQMFNGRWYAQKQLSCEFCPVEKWKSAICGLFNMKRCPKGKHCNFLHVFRNPGGAFSRADRDLPPLPSSSPPLSSRRSSSSFSSAAYRASRRDFSRHRSRSRERFERYKRLSHSRSRSRERYRRLSRSRSRSRESRRRLSDSRSPRRRKRRDTSHSRSRSRSPTTKRHNKRQNQSRSRSPPSRERNSPEDRKHSSHKKQHRKKKRSRSNSKDRDSSKKHKKKKKFHHKSTKQKEQFHSEEDAESSSPKAVMPTDLETAKDDLHENVDQPENINSDVCANTLEKGTSPDSQTPGHTTNIPTEGFSRSDGKASDSNNNNSTSLAGSHGGSKQDGSSCNNFIDTIGSATIGP